ncbi:MAG: helix-turn-helix domain-containing protein [Candidatus Anstonellaceae archaeon]
MAGKALRQLSEAGLTEGEARVYLALLELGPSTTGPIVEKSGVARSIIYQILERLAQKGLVSSVTKEKTAYFQAAQPDRLLEYMEERQKGLEESKRKLQELLPKLAGMQTSAKESEVQVFTGFRGMISVHEHTYQKLAKGEEYFFFGIPQEQPKHYHAYWQRDHIRRARAGIRCKLLFHPKTPREVLKNRNSYAGCDARYMPIEVNTPAWFMGYKNVAVIGFASESPITIEIVNRQVADSFRSYFEEFWKDSTRFK